MYSAHNVIFRVYLVSVENYWYILGKVKGYNLYVGDEVYWFYRGENYNINITGDPSQKCLSIITTSYMCKAYI